MVVSPETLSLSPKSNPKGEGRNSLLSIGRHGDSAKWVLETLTENMGRQKGCSLFFFKKKKKQMKN